MMIAKKKQDEQKRLEQENYLLQQSRMIQMGEVISMIAHQWRQPLGAVSSTSIDLQMKLFTDMYDLSKEDERTRYKNYFNSSLKRIDGYVQDLSSIINNFRNFYEPNKTSVDKMLTSPIEKVLDIISIPLESKGIKIIQNFESDRLIQMHENELTQAILNILKNALDNFIERKIVNPKIMINIKNIDEKVILAISDNGGGVSDAVLQRMFDPYFSTKNEINGTGLGLYMSKVIIETYHKAKFSAENKNGGLSFKIEFF